MSITLLGKTERMHGVKEDVMKARLSFSMLSSAVGAATLLWVGPYVGVSKAEPSQASAESLKSSPPDRTKYTRPLSAGELRPLGKSPMGASVQAANPEEAKGSNIFIVDVVVNNTDPNLRNTDIENDGEISIAINPRNPKEIVISAFSGSWGTNAPIYHSRNGGKTWTRQFSIPIPPGWDTGCPCDWTFDYGRKNELSATILASPSDRDGLDVVTGTTTNPARATSFNYFDPPPNPPFRAQETNINVPTSLGNADQPWLLVNRDPKVRRQDNVYVGWDDFNNSDGVDGPDMRVAVSYGFNPPRFTQDRQVGNSLGGVNPGLRLAKDRPKGVMWALWGRNVAAGPDNSKNMNYMLNRSTDGGQNWSLNGNSLGIAIANANSTQPQPKFGTVNALLGGVHHAAVDPKKSDLYYVYGNRDSATGNDRLTIRRITSSPSGSVTIGPERFVTGQVEAAIPQVAVTEDGTVGVFYYTFDGFSSGNFPIFTAHLALSKNRGVTFADRKLLTFLSSAQDNGNARQRVLGDYMQMKTLGNCFYGAFTGNGVAFGRPFANHDPIFFKTCSK